MAASLSIAEMLLLEAGFADDGEPCLVLGGSAAFASQVANRNSRLLVEWQPVDIRERDALQPAPNVSTVSPQGGSDRVATVLISAPFERDLARRWILAAHERLIDRGVLIIAGRNDGGIKSILADAEQVFGLPTTMFYRKKHRVGVFMLDRASTEQPDWACDPGVSPGTWHEFDLHFRDRCIPMKSQAGVFSGPTLDPGTRLLLDALPETIQGSVLDIGCGAGVVGIALASVGVTPVTMTDVNLLAIQAAMENTHRLGLLAACVLPSDVYTAIGDSRYDLIVCNPPFHRGRTVDLAMATTLIEQAPVHLYSGGAILIVANTFLAYRQLLERTFERVEIVKATPQYRVLRATDPR